MDQAVLNDQGLAEDLVGLETKVPAQTGGIERRNVAVADAVEEEFGTFFLKSKS